jgi:hypothetical protein
LNRLWIFAIAALAAAGCGKSPAEKARLAADRAEIDASLDAAALEAEANSPFALDADDPNIQTISSEGLGAGERRVAMATTAQPNGVQNTGPRGGSRARGNVLRLQPGVIVDATGFRQPMAAASIFIPYGWKTEGGVYWARDFMCTNGYNFIWSAAAPDGSMSIGIAPQTAWEMNSAGTGATRPGCQLMQIQSARQYLEYYVTRSIPGARILDFRDRPDLVQQVGIQAARTPMPAGEMRRWGEGGEILFSFSQNGRDMRGSMAAFVQFDLMVSDYSQQVGNIPGARNEFLFAFAHPGWVATAPNGQFNFAFFEALRKSIRPNMDWARAIAGHNAAIGQVALEESRKRSRIITETNDYISKLRQDTWNAQQESADRRAREFGEVIRGVETYKDEWGPGGQRELSGYYDHAWRLNDGTYVMTDDPNFDPWRDLQLEGKKLEVVK